MKSDGDVDVKRLARNLAFFCDQDNVKTNERRANIFVLRKLLTEPKTEAVIQELIVDLNWTPIRPDPTRGGLCSGVL